jgi:hypothetical protein
LSSCATVHPTAPARGGFSGGTGQNDLVIQNSGFRFPARIGAFFRGGGHQFDAAGQDLAVKYKAGEMIIADVYEYPSGGKSLATEFADRKDEIRLAHADARLLRESPVTIHPGATARRGWKAVFAISEGYHYSFPPPYQSDLLVFQRGSNFIEYRFSYSAGHRERAENEIEKFVDRLVWPEG